MPKFVIERQYLVPMYQRIVVEAANLEMACEMAVSGDIDWDTQEMDSDGAQATTITNAKVVPEEYEADQTHSLIIASRDPNWRATWGSTAPKCSATGRLANHSRGRLRR